MQIARLIIVISYTITKIRNGEKLCFALADCKEDDFAPVASFAESIA